MYSCPVQVRMSDLDPFNHVNNGAQCNLFDYGRTQFFENIFQMKIDWLKFDLVLVHTEFDFLKPIHIHDKIECMTTVVEVGNKSLKMQQTLQSADKHKIMTICRCVIVSIDRERNVSVAISQEYRDIFEKFRRNI